MFTFLQASCYLKRLTFAASALALILSIPVWAQESKTGDSAQVGTADSSQPAQERPAEAKTQTGDPVGPVTEVKPTKPEKGDTPTNLTSIPASSKAPSWHRVHLRLSGSMCYACLKDLHDELVRIPGINRVKIERPQSNYFQPISPDVTSWANAVIIYDTDRLPIEYLRGAIKQLNYNSYRIVDRLLGHEPDERDLKI